MKKQSGFTVLELITAIVVLVAAGAIFYVQKNDMAAEHRDTDRKIAINAIYYNLEQVVYPTLHGYPTKLAASQLKAMDGDLLKDPNGIIVGETGSNYIYEPSSCSGDICAHYVLKTTLEKEADFIKRSQN